MVDWSHRYGSKKRTGTISTILFIALSNVALVVDTRLKGLLFMTFERLFFTKLMTSELRNLKKHEVWIDSLINYIPWPRSLCASSDDISFAPASKIREYSIGRKLC